MKIRSLKLYEVPLPLKEEYSLSGGKLSVTELTSSIVTLETDCGRIGVGEACPWGSTYLPAYSMGIRAGIQELAKSLIDCNPIHIDHINAVMDTSLPGHNYVKSAIDMACWDLLGKVCDLPLYALLGGRFQEKVRLQSSIPCGTPEQMMNAVRTARGQGYQVHSCKVGSGYDEDVARIERIIADAQKDELFTFDVNRSWLPCEAISVMNHICEGNIYFEQPCQSADQCLQVRRATSAPIILDECIQDFQDLFKARAGFAAEAVGIKLARVGGITKARRMRDFCVMAGIAMNIEDTGGTIVSDTAVVHLATATPRDFTRATWNCCQHHSVKTATGGMRFDNGWATLDKSPGEESPGLGLSLDFECLGPAVVSVEQPV